MKNTGYRKIATDWWLCYSGVNYKTETEAVKALCEEVETLDELLKESVRRRNIYQSELSKIPSVIRWIFGVKYEQ